MYNKINMFIISDIHLGHNINNATDMIQNLYLFLEKHEQHLNKTNVFIIPGDTYDRLLNANSKDYVEIIKFLTYLVKFCASKNIKLRILEGTPSHDMRQLKVLYTIIQDLNINVDFKYIDTLSIEHMDDLDIDILYLPDEWKSNPKAIWEDIERVLKEHNKKKVDIVVMHGGFKYQIPMLAEHMHDENLFVNLTYGGPVISGHIHNRSAYKNIIIPGSFDRLTFNDEDEEKGGLLIIYDKKEKTFNFKYLNNKYALLFKTFDLRKTTLKNVIKKLKNIKQNKAHIRFIVKKEENLIDSLLDIEAMFPKFRFIIKTVKNDNDVINDNILEAVDNNLNKKLTPDIIKTYIKNKVSDSKKLNLIIDEFETILKSI